MLNSNFIVRKRIITLFFVFAACLLMLTGRVFWVQFVRGAELSEMAQQNRMRDVPVESKRGIIYDRNGQELAISISSDSIYAIPAEVITSGEADKIAAQLARILDIDEEKLLQRITRQSSYEWVNRQVLPEQSQEIRKLELPGIGITEESKRYYPKGTLAAHVLGISGVDNTGLDGIDFYYDNLVGGKKGRIVIEHDAANRPIPEAMHKYIAPVDGANLILTIDETIQYIAERELEKVFQERQPKRAAIIVMDPKTGEILAMAARPTFNPNNYGDFPNDYRRNWCIHDAYEPGSTMKIVTAAMAMEEKVVDKNSKFYCPGYVKVGKETISCSNNKAHGDQTFAEIVENSCNVGFVSVGLDLGLERYFKYLTKFGFGKCTGVDLPGEAAGILVNEKNAMQIDLATMAMGQANAVTPIQLITAVSAVANDGKLMQPHLVKQVINNEGEIIKENKPRVVEQVVSAETADELCLILEGEVVNGTGQNAYIEGYRCGGKTGTAQKIKPGGGYMAAEYIASFIGIAPANNPRLAILVVVDAPQGYPYYGGWVAAPVFRAVMEDSLRYLEEPRSESKENNSAANIVDKAVVPDVVNLPLSEAVEMIKQRGLQAKVSGDGQIVWQQTPLAHTQLQRGSQVIVRMSSNDQAEQTGEVTVPDLQGKSMKEVAGILADLGLHLIPEGTGLAYEQAPEAGKTMAPGSSIKVKFQPVGE